MSQKEDLARKRALIIMQVRCKAPAQTLLPQALRIRSASEAPFNPW